MSDKTSIAEVTVIGIGAFVLGTVIGKLGLFKPAPFAAKGKSKKATIKLKADKSCSQTVGGYSDAFPSLGRSDTIAWYGKDKDDHDVDIVVEFPDNETPFTDANGNPVYQFKTGDIAGPSTSSPGDYAFKSVTVGGSDCSNPADPGVHVDP
jgi:hypothetical protein